MLRGGFGCLKLVRDLPKLNDMVFRLSGNTQPQVGPSTGSLESKTIGSVELRFLSNFLL